MSGQDSVSRQSRIHLGKGRGSVNANIGENECEKMARGKRRGGARDLKSYTDQPIRLQKD